MACLYFGGVVTDARSYFLTQTLPALADWLDTTGRLTSAGGYVQRLVDGWPRPEEYDETDDYVVGDWLGLGLPRWVAVHIVLAIYGSSAWSDGESIADVEARLGRTVGSVMLKVILNDPYIGAGATVEVTATRADGGGSAVLTCDIPSGSQPGDLFFLRQGAHDSFPGVPCRWFTDVTLVHVTGQTNDLGFYVVNDGPAWNSSAGIVVAHQAYTPFACDVEFLRAKSLDHLRDVEGRMQVYYENAAGQLVRRWYTPTEDGYAETILWPTQVADSHPNIMRTGGSPHLTLLFIRDADSVRVAQSLDNGRTWGDPVSIASGYTIAEAEIVGSRNLICAMLFDGTDWKRAVLEWVPATAQWQVRGSVTTIVAGATQRGSLRKEADGSLTFVYVDVDGEVQYLRGHLDNGNTLTWS